MRPFVILAETVILLLALVAVVYWLGEDLIKRRPLGTMEI
uniref:Uncharacterized protein n=1 Tax=Rhodocyclus tenuis TaxID=1066 RepID=A0A840G8K5_RHOTE|nr:hypothetical protein [Rhodocyclus tenuis]